MTITRPRVLHSILEFVRGFLNRDRYLTEALAAVTTFVTGVIALMTLDDVGDRVSLQGMGTMPFPELCVLVFCLPGIVSSRKVWRQGAHHEGGWSLAVILSIVALSLTSLALELDNWVFWAAFAIQLGLLKGYALIQEWGSLRWAMSCLGAYFWINLTISLIQHMPRGGMLLIAAIGGMAAANLLTVSRLAGVRGHAS